MFGFMANWVGHKSMMVWIHSELCKISEVDDFKHELGTKKLARS